MSSSGNSLILFELDKFIWWSKNLLRDIADRVSLMSFFIEIGRLGDTRFMLESLFINWVIAFDNFCSYNFWFKPLISLISPFLNSGND